ncbi:hypothetical protein F3J34_15395 [Klebsiella sp. Ap-873]|nr:hypothetical protein [Klebsiella sp. Ap-873]
MKISQLSDVIHNTLKSVDRPEFTLMQRYEVSNSDQKIAFVGALIGLLIEQDRMMRSGRHFSAGITVKGEGDEANANDS